MTTSTRNSNLLTREPTVRELDDFLVDVEHYSHHWLARDHAPAWDLPDGERLDDHAFWMIGADLRVDKEGDENPETWTKVKLTEEMARKGWALLREKYPVVFSHFALDNSDSEDSDTLAQLVLLGEVVYG